MDQSAGEETRLVVETFADSRVNYRRMGRAGGCPARNLGAALATAGIVAFLDDDCAPRADWLANIARHFREQPKLQFIFGNLRAPAHDDAHGAIPECLAGDHVRAGDGVRKLMLHCSGGNMAARKSFLREHGAFDELLGPARPSVRANDISIAYKAHGAGNWAALAEVEVLHLHGYRPHAELASMFASSMFGSGVFWGRQLRRRDFAALRHFAAAELSLVGRPLRLALHGQRPRGFRPAVTHLRGFIEGLRLAPAVGHLSGQVFRAMEASGQLDPGSPAAPAPPAVTPTPAGSL